MDNLSDPALKLKYNKSKFRVKSWESEFRKKTGNNPSKDDIRGAPCEIREAYKWYWQIKIHSIGQDSMLDATFSEQRKSEPTTTVTDITEKNDLTSKNDEIGDTPPSSCIEQHSAGCSESSRSLPDKCIETPDVELTPPDTKVSTLEKDTPSTDLPKSVWGSHLNKEADEDINSKKKNLNRSSSSFHLSEKLFVGAKFKKRNPRKSLSFSAGRVKERNSLVSSDSLVPPSDSSFSVDSSQGLDDGFPVSEFENAISSQNDESMKTCEFKMVKKTAPSSMQPVSAIQKMMEEDLRPTKPKAERSLDKGWLERVMQADDILSQEVQKNLSSAISGPLICESKTNQSIASEDSDDDIIYGSDTESKSPRKVEKEEKARLALRSTSFTEQAVFTAVPNSEGNVNASYLSEKPEANGRKRKLDAIEAAMAVLSERRKNDKILSQPIKKVKRCDSSKPETRAQTKKSVSLNKVEDPCSDMEIDENQRIPDSSNPKKTLKSGLSKQDALEKKVASGTVNDNFVRINIQKKVFVRGKKTMNFQKYKKQQWKNKKKELSDQASAYMSRMDPSDSAAGGGLQKCFQCGDVGHFARQCTKMKGDSLMPYGAEDEEEESPFPSLAEVEKMAKEKRESVHCRTRTKQDENSPADEQEPPNAMMNLTDQQECESQDFIEEKKSVNFEEDTDDASIMKEPVVESERHFDSVGPLYPLKSDGSMQSTPPEVYDTLRKFGHQSFRPGQEVAIMRILSGLSTLVTLSTGSGKSLCYQLPAYLYATKRNCITLIVSPLVSLMDDQISGLPSFISGAALHTAQTEKQREKVMDLAKAGKLHFLLVSPEAVVAGERKTGFGSLLRELPNIAFACIDEAHCVSQWSHNFRPSYLVIFKVLREKLGVKTALGLTATATQTAVSSIIEHMGIPDGRNGVIQDTPLPNNLLLTVSKDSNRDQALIKLLETPEFKDFKSIIVYCTRREECERLATLLRTCLKNNAAEGSTAKRKVSTTSEAYHAGLSASRRKQVQTAFMSGDLRIVVATVAFGMGINKADIRSVVHFNMPRNFESYVQEVGRAGRDGLTSRCHLFLNSEGKDLNELRRHIFADSVDRHSIRKLLQRVFVPCKCGGSSYDRNLESTPSDEQSNVMKGSASEDKVQKESIQGCVGHEVAFSVEETVAALDLPEENITTLLCYLELRDKNLLQIMPKAYTKCRIQSYKGMKHIREVARSCPPLAMAIAMDQMFEKSEKNNHYIEFAVVEIASAIGWDSGIVKRELMNLEWTKVNGSSRRSGIKVEFSELGFRLKAPGNLSPEKLDAALDFLHERVLKQERAALSQLQTIFSTVTSVSYPSVTAMMDSDASDMETHSNDLKAVVRAYFQEDTLIAADLKSEEKLEHGEQIANDIRQIVSMYRDCSFTGRAVARIFHGIGSPNFPPQVWGRCRFWRAHLESDFKLICLLATRVLLKMR